MAYTTAEIQTIITKLEGGLAGGVIQISHEGKSTTFRSISDIRDAIAYFTALYSDASDAPVTSTQKTRTYYTYSNQGFGSF